MTNKRAGGMRRFSSVANSDMGKCIVLPECLVLSSAKQFLDVAQRIIAIRGFKTRFVILVNIALG